MELRQTGSYDDYVDKFEELKACMLMEDSGKFTDEYFVASLLMSILWPVF